MKPANFQAAMMQTLAEDAVEQPCVGCGGETDTIGIYEADRDSLTAFGFKDPTPRTFVYPICESCIRRADRELVFGAGIEMTVAQMFLDTLGPEDQSNP
jgi:hypothetical protein